MSQVIKLPDRTEYRNASGQLHRTNGPAVKWANGAKEYWKNGKRHRTNGPAIEWANGAKAYYQDDQLHRLNGPAFEDSDGTKTFSKNGQRIYPLLICENNNPVLAVLNQGMFYNLSL